MQLSKRLQAVADLLEPCDTLADVGTDHGYIPIYAIRQNIAKRAIAMDINRGPIHRAASHIAEYGLEAYIETRCCDGVAALAPGEADAVVIAGMGGSLMQKILTAGENIFHEVREIILQPQSEIPEVRTYLAGHGYRIEKEDMVLEDGKFYTVMQVHRGSMTFENPLYREYGASLLERRHPVLKQYLEKKFATGGCILRQLYQSGRGGADLRVLEIKKEMQNIQSALEYYDS